ncbi:hypothetical protein AVEN_247616-1 [Araneus ventricosus]|uniref:Uncharacterized protein n=1 Tax=Araneus ventricosus TaxID=182803 RepID=A0A4Y2N6P2_ARAVE|nr:hypothetical protein AVEN_247616-1 [Araneus ventricosus]
MHREDIIVKSLFHILKLIIQRELINTTSQVPFTLVIKSRCIDNRSITQAATNHGFCPSYFRRFNIKACTCRCGEDSTVDIQHYAQFCPLTSHLRNKICSTDSLRHIIANSDTSRELISILQYVHEGEIFQLED